MPIYEYRCDKCNLEFEKLRSLKDRDEELFCPNCGKSKPKKLFSAFSGKMTNGDLRVASGCGNSSGFS